MGLAEKHIFRISSIYVCGWQPPTGLENKFILALGMGHGSRQLGLGLINLHGRHTSSKEPNEAYKLLPRSATIAMLQER